MGAIAKDIQAAQKLVNNLESKLEMRKGERHSILMHCKVSHRLAEIRLSENNIEEITEEDFWNVCGW